MELPVNQRVRTAKTTQNEWNGIRSWRRVPLTIPREHYARAKFSVNLPALAHYTRRSTVRRRDAKHDPHLR